jgi:hypothetical protein
LRPTPPPRKGAAHPICPVTTSSSFRKDQSLSWLAFEVVPFSVKLVGMIPLTVVLIAEHKMFCDLFDHIQELLPRVENLAELKHLARLVEGLLRNHAKAEEDLFLQVHDGAAKGRHRNGRLHQEHHEIDARLKRVCGARDLAQARALFKVVLVAARKHFTREERVFFPRVEKSIEPQILEKLGTVWLLRHHSPVHWTI